MKPSDNWTLEQKQASFALTSRGEFRHLMTAPQKRYYDFYKANPDVQQYGLYCTRKLGKTFLHMLIAYHLALTKQSRISRFVFPTLKLAKDVAYPIIDEIKQYLPKNAWPVLYKSESKIVFPNGCQIILGGASPDNIDNNRGPYADALFKDEEGFWDAGKYEYALQGVLYPQLTLTRGPIFSSTTPPDSMDHPYIVNTYPTLVGLKSMFVYTVYDNPLLTHVDIDKIAALYGAGDPEKGKNSKGFKREYLCVHAPDESRLVVPEFDETKHLYSGGIYPNPKDKLSNLVNEYVGYVTADYGVGSQDFAGILTGYLDHTTGVLMITGEDLLKGKSLRPFIEAFHDLADSRLQLCPERIETADMFDQVRVTARDEHNFAPRRPIKRKVDDLIGMLRNAFELDKIRIHSSCKELIRQLSNGQWKETESKRDFQRSDLMGHLDLLMALAYKVQVVNWRKRPGISNNHKLRLGR